MGLLDDNAKALWDELETKKGLLVYEKSDGNLQFTYKGTPADAVGLNIMAQEAIVRRAWDTHLKSKVHERAIETARANRTAAGLNTKEALTIPADGRIRDGYGRIDHEKFDVDEKTGRVTSKIPGSADTSEP